MILEYIIIKILFNNIIQNWKYFLLIFIMNDNIKNNVRNKLSQFLLLCELIA